MADFILKVVFSCLGVVICGIPTWIYLGANALLSPEGFWQNFLLLGLGAWLLGGAQFFLFLGLIG